MQITYRKIEYDSCLPARIRLKMTPAERCRGEPHWHREPELIYVESGEAVLTAANKKHILKSGETFIVNSGEIHSLDTRNANCLAVHLFYDFIKQFEPTLDSFEFRAEGNPGARRELNVLMQKLLTLEQSGCEPYPDLKKQALLMQLMRLLLVKCKREKQLSIYGAAESRSDDAKIAENFIESHFREKISLSDVAKALGRKDYSMSAYFKELMGMGFRDYLRKIRAKHVLEDLATLDVSIEDVALRNGFGNRNAVTNACKSFYGVTPIKLKRQMQQHSAVGDNSLAEAG